MLLTAVLAAVMAPTAWADWGSDSEANTYYVTGDLSETLTTAASPSGDTTIYMKPGTANTGTLSAVTIDAGDKLVITGVWNNADAASNFSKLTLTKVTGGNNSTLEIGGNQGSANGTAQVVYVNNNDEKSYNVRNTIVNSGATLDFSGAKSSDAFNHEIEMTMTVGGTLQLGKTRQTLGTFTLTLNDGKVLGTNNKTDNSSAGHGGLDFKKDSNGKGKIVSTGTSSISSGIRLNSDITIDVQDGTLTVDNIMNGGNNTANEGITKQGTGTLVITASKTYAEGFYAGNTTLEDGGTIKYDISSTSPFSYAGTISGTGNIEKAGTAAMTIAAVSELDGDITVSGGSLTITTLDVSKTLGVSVGSGSTLSIGTVTLDVLNHSLDVVSEGGDPYYTSDGTNSSTNGFQVSDTVYRLFDGYEWNGSVNGFEVSYADGDTLLSSGGTAGTVYYLNEGTLSISESSEYIKQQAQAYYLKEGTTLKIDGHQNDNMSASDVLINATGAGSVTLTESAQVTNAQTSATGTLTIGDGSTTDISLTIGGAWNEDGNFGSNTASISSFSKVVLDKGSISYNAKNNTINNLEVTSNGGEFKVYDQDKSTPINFAGTTTLNGDLTISTSWKYNLNFAAVTGAGNLTATGAGGDANDVTTITIGSLQGYTGTISATKGAAAFNLNMTTGGDAKLTGLTLDGVTANISTSGTLGLGTVNLSNGSSLALLNSGSARTTNITSLSVTGAATIGTKRNSNCYAGTINIDTLTNTGDSAELTLKNGSQTDDATVYNLSGTSSMTGTIHVQSDSFRGSTDANAAERSRTLQVNLNSKEVAAKAVINFQDATTLGNANGAGDTNNVASNYNILGVGVDGAKVAGLTGETTNAATVKSTEGNRTLEIVGSGTYTTNAKVESNVKLLMSGSGTQNFSGDMSAFNGTVEVSGGTLGFTKADGSVTVSSLTLSGGTLNVTNSLTLNNVIIDLTKYTAGVNIDDLVAAGSLISGENYSVSYAGGVTTVGNYTGTVEKIDNSLVLTWSDLPLETTSLTTTISGVNGLFDSENNMLTLNIDENDSLANVGDVTISGISDDIMKDILGLTGLPTDGMVGITLRDKDGVEFAATADQMIGFQGKDGIYYGQNVENVGWVYQVVYIPEPATATLSLLALAGLAARRRRK